MNTTKEECTFSALVFILSYECNCECSICYSSCNPTANEAVLDLKTINNTIRKASQIKAFPKHVAFAGGEPFLYPELLCDGVVTAHRDGFYTTVTTNGSIGSRPRLAEKWLSRLETAGLDRIELSIDIFHQEFVPHKAVRELIRKAQQHNIAVTVRSLITRRHPLRKSLGWMDASDLDGLEIYNLPCIRIGRAAIELYPSDLWEYDLSSNNPCAQHLKLTVNPNGDTYPCCSGSELCSVLCLGNCRQETLSQIFSEAVANPVLGILSRKGPSGFYDILRRFGVNTIMGTNYTSACELCVDVFKNMQCDTLATIIDQYS